MTNFEKIFCWFKLNIDFLVTFRKYLKRLFVNTIRRLSSVYTQINQFSTTSKKAFPTNRTNVFSSNQVLLKILLIKAKNRQDLLKNNKINSDDNIMNNKE